MRTPAPARARLASWLLLVALPACAPPSVHAAPPPLGHDPLRRPAYMAFAVGTTPACAAVADLDQDGIPDVVTANRGSNDISILRGRGDGTFTARFDLPAGTAPRYVVAGDLNGDGVPDIVVANSTANTISVYLGPVGTTTTHTDYATGAGPVMIAMGDLNGDGWPDLVVVNSKDNTLTVLLGDAIGTFHPGPSPTTNSNPVWIAVGDLNGDGVPDLAVSDGANGNVGWVSIFLGHGDGTFAARTDYAVPGSPTGVVIADLDGDGHPDAAVANSASNNLVSIFHGNGDGTLGGHTDLPCLDYLQGLAVADLDGDGKPDLIVSTASTSNAAQRAISVFRGHGDGTFDPRADYAAGSFPTAVAVADVNEDGRPDLVLTASSLNAMVVVLGNGDATLGTRDDVPTASAPNVVAIADLDRDGRPDLVAACEGANSVSVLLGHGDGTFAPHVDYATSGVPTALAVGDLNGDGVPDLAVSCGTSISVLLGNGSGQFAGIPTQPDVPSGGSVQPIAIADLNRDGRPDLIAGGPGVVLVYLGNGDGTFAAPVSYPGPIEPEAMAVGDLNGDGIPDVVLSDFNSLVAVLLGNGDGTLAAQVGYATANGGVFGVAIADLNGDGHPDVVTANEVLNGEVSVLLGHGDGTLAPHVDYAAPHYGTAIAVADMDGDGHPDVVVTNLVFSTVTGLLGRGDGTFGERVIWGPDGVIDPFPDGVFGIAIGDLDGDGVPDIAIPRGNNDEIALFLSGGSGAPTAALASLVSSAAQPGLVKLTWFAPTAGFSASVERRTADTPWSVVGTVSADGSGLATFADRAVEAGTRYDYRLTYTEGTTPRTTADTWVAVPVAARFALAGARPNPARGALMVSLSLPSGSPARLELYDVNGRRVLEQDLAGAGPGDLSVRLTPDRPLRAGLYFVRLTQGGRSLTARACLVE